MSKERLQDIKKKYNYERLGEFIDVKLVNPYELKWLIQQAECVEELEDKCNYLSDMNEMLVDLNGVLPDEPELYIKLKKENKRYREAINNIIEKAMLFGTNEEVYEAIQDAIKALEGEE